MTKVMLVEDDNNLREIYGARLMAEGYEIVSASDGEEALALAVKEKPALIVADVMMPKISGFDMLDILRTTPETKNTKVIIMTALSQPEDRSRGESLGADKYLVKSQVTLEDVVAAVHEILGDSGGSTPPSSSPSSPPAPAGGGSSGQTAPQQPAQPAGESGQGDNTGQSPGQQPPQQQAAPPSEQTKPQAPPTEPEDQPPKVEGASDAPEPASKKKKIIKPINDLNHEREDFLKMVAEEEAREKQSTPGASVGPVDDTTDEQQQAKMADSMAKEKKQMEEDVKKMVNDGTIDNEAASPTVQPGQSGDAQQQPAPKPPTGQEQAQKQPAQQTPQPQAGGQSQPEPQDGPDTADVPQPGSSVQPQDGQDSSNESGGGQPAQPAQPQQPPAPKPPAAPPKPPAEQANQAGSEDANSQVPQPPKEKPQQDQGSTPKSNPDDIAL